jgi:formylglycine-generating enzyme required for sulfatase activity
LEKDFLGPIDPGRMLEEIGDPATGHERRALIGVRLALVGDPRPGVGLREDGLPDIVWCKVPAGEIILEENAGTFTVQPFSIAKHLVTWKQYRAFVEDPGGYPNSEWWRGLLFQPGEPPRQLQKYANHPADNVCWLDAMAFCRWLNHRLGNEIPLGNEIRLPTEWEWQQAATGGDPAWEYPWGPEWNSNFTNIYESGLNRSTAVGLYPQGAAPGGVLDMSGNLWEWCLNEFDNPERTEVGGDARRVRGGSWHGCPDYARAAYRFGDHPDYRYGGIGFRVVCSSPLQT